jgi:hypothetical protein
VVARGDVLVRTSVPDAGSKPTWAPRASTDTARPITGRNGPSSPDSVTCSWTVAAGWGSPTSSGSGGSSSPASRYSAVVVQWAPS